MKVIELTASQSTFVEDDTSKAVAFISGLGGGKSLSGCLKMVKMKLKYPTADLLFIMPTFSMFRDILFPTLTELLEGTGIEYQINKTTGEIFFKNAGRIILKSGDDPSKIIGFNVLAVFMDELDTIPTEKAKDIFVRAIARARVLVQKLDDDMNPVFDENGEIVYAINQLVIFSSPEGFRFCYHQFVKKKPDNYTLIQASGRENIHLPADFYDNLEMIYSPELVASYVNGEFVNMTAGAVYTEFDRTTCDSDQVYREGETLHISIDFNVRNVNGTVYVEREKILTPIVGYAYNNSPTLHGVHHFKEIADTPELIEVIKNRYPTSPVYCYPDASGSSVTSKGITLSDISLLKKAGFHVKAFSKNKRVLDRVQSANSAFKTGLVKYNTNLVPDVTDSLEQQVYNPITELPDKKASTAIDDINDSATYIIIYRYPVVSRTTRKKKLKGT